MKTPTQAVRNRTNRLRSILEDSVPGNTLTFSELKEAIDESTLSDRQLTYALSQCKPHLASRGRELRVGKDYAEISAVDETQFDQRLKQSVIEKKLIGDAVWKVLFGIGGSESNTIVRSSWEGELGDTFGSLDPVRATAIQRKISILRSRTNCAIIIDAGSTNTLVTQQFLGSVNKIPITLQTPAGEPSGMITPIFITNSIVIAGMIGQSPLRWGITLRVIGGTDRVDRRSLGGELSLLWLRACHSQGIMTSVDVAIIGSTGVEMNRHELHTLCCDDPSETALKSRLLDMANLRIVVLDSKKLDSGSVNYTFAPVLSPNVDLIIIDSGKTTGLTSKVKDFCREASAHGVGVAIASSSKT